MNYECNPGVPTETPYPAYQVNNPQWQTNPSQFWITSNNGVDNDGANNSDGENIYQETFYTYEDTICADFVGTADLELFLAADNGISEIDFNHTVLGTNSPTVGAGPYPISCDLYRDCEGSTLNACAGPGNTPYISYTKYTAKVNLIPGVNTLDIIVENCRPTGSIIPDLSLIHI